MTEQSPLDPAGAGSRAAALWDYLSQWFARGLEPPAAAPRQIVTADDACLALLLAAMAVEQAVSTDDGRLAPDVAGELMSLLMVARDYIRPLPDPEPLEDGSDPISRDLQTQVDIVRVAVMDARERARGAGDAPL